MTDTAPADYSLTASPGRTLPVAVRAKGMRIWDRDGQEWLDACGGAMVMSLGHCHPRLVEAAQRQLEKITFTYRFSFSNEPMIELAALVREIAPMERGWAFFNSSGSEANDTVMRMVRHYWTVSGQPKRSVFISRRNAYHGSTMAGASLGGMKAMHPIGGLPIPGVEHVAQPYKFGEGFNEEEEAFGARCAQEIEDRIIAVGPENVAAFIGEPVQGAGGVIIPPKGYWKRVDAICKKYGILLVVDEVICGFGRLGEWFGFQHFGMMPDLVPMAKGLSSGYLPISAVGVSHKIVDVLREKGGDFVHGYTYSGHPVAAAVALKNLEIIEREGLVGRVKSDLGPYFAKALKRLSGDPLVGEVRSLGLLGAVEIVSKPGTNERFTGKEGKAGPIVRDTCIKNGLMVRGIRDSIVMCPPLIITHAEIDRMIDIIARSLREAEPALRALKPED